MEEQVDPMLPFKFLSLTAGKWTSHILATAAELRLADLLSPAPLSAAELAKKAGANASMMFRLLRALATLGVVEPVGADEFKLGALGQFLRSDVPGSMRALSAMGGRPWHDRCWEQLTESVRTGTPGAQLAFGTNLWDHFSRNAEDFANFNDAMTSASATMHFMAAEAYDFSSFKQVVDVGGGHGRLLALVLNKTPGLRGIVFDRQELTEGARAEIQKAGVADRCEFIGGDFFVGVPAGGDAYMMGHILHDWDDERAEQILRSCRKGITPGGTLIVLDAVIKGGPQDFGTLMDLEISLLFGGKDRTEAEFAALFRKAGFELSQVVPTRSSISIVEGKAV